MRQMAAFHVGRALTGSPFSNAPMLCATAVTMDSIMKPVFGTPTGTGLEPIGGMATQTPMAKMSGKAGLRWYLSTGTKPRGFPRER